MAEKIGFFSDVHSNLGALQRMRTIIAERQLFEWYFGGDIVGWLYEPIECVQLLMRMMAQGEIRQAVVGNHDLLARDVFPDLPNQMARKLATAFSAGALSREPEARQFLENLPWLVDLSEAGCIITHHSPFCLPQAGEPPTIGHFKYLSQDFESQLGAWANCKWPVILSGHDHIAAVHRIPAGLSEPTLDDVATLFPEERGSLCVPIQPGFRYWVQVGAAGGPPRDGALMLNWAEVAEGESITLRRLWFDFSATKTLIERQPFGSMLDWERFAGRTDKPIAQGRASL